MSFVLSLFAAIAVQKKPGFEGFEGE
ncbi:MAG: hypothetical protein ABIX01_20555 [Chitinophagaceae bacterium]